MGARRFKRFSIARRNESSVVFYVFDLLHVGNESFLARPLAERRRALHRLTFNAPILLSTPLPGEPVDIEAAVRAAGLEGVVAKRVDSI